MRWPWTREKRESSFTDALVVQLLSSATGASLALPTATAALETCCGLVSRAFSAAEVAGPAWARAALSPQCLGMIGRALIRDGEIVFAVDAEAGELRLFPAADHDVTGGHSPASWTYRLNLAGPSYLATRTPIPAEGVLHFMYTADPARPWHGVGPIESAKLAGRLSAETVKALADEAGGPRGHLLPVPETDGQDGTITELKADIKRLNGSTAVVESMSSGWQTGDHNTAPRSDWEAKRLGFDAPASLIQAANLATREILSACGVSPALFEASAAAAVREAWRQLLFGTIAPLGRLVAHELSRKLEAEVSLDWHELRASDLAGRARAFQSMVGGGMDVAKAAALAGLMVDDG